MTQIVAVVGLGNVGLPLAVAFGRHYRTIGFDLSSDKIAAYRTQRDPTGELAPEEFRASRKIEFTMDAALLREADAVIVAVPTPIDNARLPDFAPLLSASRMVGDNLKRGAIVVYESTVYPGATEEVCVPVLEQRSGLRWKQDFFVGYSPERINPGDKKHTLTRITKVVSGDTPQTLEKVAQLYAQVVEAGVYRASSIRVAEAAKVIENTQRDLNIALMNELAIIFNRLGLDTHEVLEAAGTKWNFLPFRPGLVGGHCIGVDPYYLTHKAETIGYHPQVILAGRRITNNVGPYVAQRLVKMLINQGFAVKGARVGVLGITFKENVPDLRNSRVPDIIAELREFGIDPLISDPHADAGAVRHEYGLDLVPLTMLQNLDALIVAVAHRTYAEQGWDKLMRCIAPGGVCIDV